MGANPKAPKKSRRDRTVQVRDPPDRVVSRAACRNVFRSGQSGLRSGSSFEKDVREGGSKVRLALSYLYSEWSTTFGRE